MDEENPQENPDTIVQGEEKTPEVKTEVKSDIDVKTVLAQKDHFRDKAEKLEKELSELRGKSSESNLTLESIKIGKRLEKYSDEEIDSVAKIIKSNNPNDILSALDNSFIKQGIELEREKLKEQNKIPGSSSSGFTSDEKSADEIKKMSPEEHRKYFEKQMRKGQGI